MLHSALFSQPAVFIVTHIHHFFFYQINGCKRKLLAFLCYPISRLHGLSFGNADEKKDLSQPEEFCAFQDPDLALAETFSCLRSDDW